ncbi:hypothetical protein [Paraburkholderia pallida]|uniref:Uncharacterized protein n=1 Tax=Paraburkholderia pallida TaxID=2547399 RepID=A0A4P7CU92_9BURK|nr:hypothetical protein [Paraburkholderia pallida]QBQ99638.1 hypothetical protein E1956_21015 [Paraburkholderia pallida]
MSLAGKFRHPDALPIFVSPRAWGLVHEPAPGELLIATESADEGRAILCVLSLLQDRLRRRIIRPMRAFPRPAFVRGRATDKKKRASKIEARFSETTAHSA